jgi:hypothetical protein
VVYFGFDSKFSFRCYLCLGQVPCPPPPPNCTLLSCCSVPYKRRASSPLYLTLRIQLNPLAESHWNLRYFIPIVFPENWHEYSYPLTHSLFSRKPFTFLTYCHLELLCMFLLPEVSGADLGPETVYSNCSRFPQSLLANSWMVPQMVRRQFSYTSSSNYYNYIYYLPKTSINISLGLKSIHSRKPAFIIPSVWKLAKEIPM